MDKNNNPKRNSEGYADTTAYQAEQQISEEDRRMNQLIRTLKFIIDAAGYDLVERIVLRDRRTGRIYR